MREQIPFPAIKTYGNILLKSAKGVVEREQREDLKTLANSYCIQVSFPLARLPPPVSLAAIPPCNNPCEDIASSSPLPGTSTGVHPICPFVDPAFALTASNQPLTDPVGISR